MLSAFLPGGGMGAGNVPAMMRGSAGRPQTAPADMKAEKAELKEQLKLLSDRRRTQANIVANLKRRSDDNESLYEDPQLKSRLAYEQAKLEDIDLAIRDMQEGKGPSASGGKSAALDAFKKLFDSYKVGKR
jgi:Skp family chaperone for outer membrane proteins